MARSTYIYTILDPGVESDCTLGSPVEVVASFTVKRELLQWTQRHAVAEVSDFKVLRARDGRAAEYLIDNLPTIAEFIMEGNVEL